MHLHCRQLWQLQVSLCFQLGVLSHKQKGLLQTRLLLLALCPSSLAMLPRACIQTLIPYLGVALNTLGSAKSSRLALSGSEGIHQKNEEEMLQAKAASANSYLLPMVTLRYAGY